MSSYLMKKVPWLQPITTNDSYTNIDNNYYTSFFNNQIVRQVPLSKSISLNFTHRHLERISHQASSTVTSDFASNGGLSWSNYIDHVHIYCIYLLHTQRMYVYIYIITYTIHIQSSTISQYINMYLLNSINLCNESLSYLAMSGQNCHNAPLCGHFFDSFSTDLNAKMPSTSCHL